MSIACRNSLFHLGAATNDVKMASIDAIARHRAVAWVVVAGMLASLVPGRRAYRVSLADGLSPRA